MIEWQALPDRRRVPVEICSGRGGDEHMTATLDDEVVDLRRANAELQQKLGECTAELQVRTAERDDSEAQKAAMAEILEAINTSPGNLAPVFDAMLERGTRLCEATYGQLATYDGELFRFVAAHGEAPFLRQHPTGPLRPTDGVTWLRIVGGAPFVHIDDVADTDLYRSGHETARAIVDIGGGRTLLTVALRKDELLLGTFTVYRQEVRPFSDKHMALVQNFAAQAVIAMENARLLTETREALDQQTATAEVLQVINSSPGDLAPVFDAILEKAHSLCGVARGSLELYDGQNFRAVAMRGLADGFADQPCILHRDDGLRREVLQQRNLLVRERLKLLAVEVDRSKHVPVLL